MRPKTPISDSEVNEVIDQIMTQGKSLYGSIDLRDFKIALEIELDHRLGEFFEDYLEGLNFNTVYRLYERVIFLYKLNQPKFHEEKLANDPVAH